jgi:hypothetical protein
MPALAELAPGRFARCVHPHIETLPA